MTRRQYSRMLCATPALAMLDELGAAQQPRLTLYFDPTVPQIAFAADEIHRIAPQLESTPPRWRASSEPLKPPPTMQGSFSFLTFTWGVTKSPRRRQDSAIQ